MNLEPFVKSFLANRSLTFEVNVLFPSAYSELPDNTQIHDCYANKTYCSIGLTDIARTLKNNTHLLDEGIRQKCMWNLDRDYFWEYAREYFDLCVGPLVMFQELDIQECARLAKEKVDSEIEPGFVLSSEKVEACYREAFTDFDRKQASDVSVFSKQLITSTPLYNFEVVPALLIDRYIVRGGLGSISLASSICDSITDPPKHICNNLADIKSLDLSLPRKARPAEETPAAPQEFSSSSLLFALVVLLIGLGLIVLCVVVLRRFVDRSFSRSIRDEVTDSVKKYMRVKEQERDTTSEI